MSLVKEQQTKAAAILDKIKTDKLKRYFKGLYGYGLNFAERLFQFFKRFVQSSSLGRTIFISNIIALVILVAGILYLNQLRAGLVGAKIESLQIQGEIIAGAIAASATVDTNRIIIDPESLLETRPDSPLIGPEDTFSALEFPIDPERVAPILRRLIKPTGTRARIYDADGTLIIDSDRLYTDNDIFPIDLPPVTQQTQTMGIFKRMEIWIRRALFYSNLPIYKEDTTGDASAYQEVGISLSGQPAQMVRVTEKGKHIVSVAVPIQRLRRVLGSIMLSTKKNEFKETIRAERKAIVRLTFFVIGISLLSSLFLARYIALPMRRLSAAATRVKESIKAREEIPDFTHRSDEIGNLSGALRDMTAALYRRLDAIETFAADVAHELKNPLTSLRSAAETLKFVKDDEQKKRLIDIINNDVKRLDRLISDISDASRLDAELAREDTTTIDMRDLLRGIIDVFNDIHRGDQPDVELVIYDQGEEKEAFLLQGHDSRLGQVFNNLLDNALSFSPPNGKVWVLARRQVNQIIVQVEDEGPGIAEAHLEKIFNRFYTDRPDSEEFGNNSGLGLNISRQIISAHNGEIRAENRYDVSSYGDGLFVDDGDPIGARFIITLPAKIKKDRKNNG